MGLGLGLDKQVRVRVRVRVWRLKLGLGLICHSVSAMYRLMSVAGQGLGYKIV